MSDKEISDLMDEEKKNLQALQGSESGQSLIRLLQEVHDIILTNLVNAEASEIHVVAELQGRYKIVQLLLERIMGDEDAESG